MSLPVAQAGFTTSGSLSLVDLATKPVQYSVDVLARISRAGVDSYTLVVGQALSQLFLLGKQGQSNVQNAIASLRCCSSVGDALYFGVGVEGFVRMLAKTTQGLTLVALAATLSECYPEDVVAQTLYEIVALIHSPDRLTPSVNEWLNVVKACQGALATSSFPVRAEVLMSLHEPSFAKAKPDKQHTVFYLRDRGCAEPEDIAAALLSISRITRGEIVSMTLSGGFAAGFLAALAEWLFGLSVLIENGEGQVLYANCSDAHTAQVHVVFVQPAHDDIKGKPSTGSEHTQALQVTSATYHLREVTDLFSYSKKSNTAFVGGRLAWDTCLVSTFGEVFRRLIYNPLAPGRVLGSAARIFQAMAIRDPELERRLPGTWSDYGGVWNGYGGLGFVTTLLKWFPELRVAENHMLGMMGVSIHQALVQYDDALEQISVNCSCSGCRYKSPSLTGCQRLVIETVIVLGSILSCLEIYDDLLPTRGGLQSIYLRLIGERHSAQHRTDPAASGLDQDSRQRFEIFWILRIMTTYAELRNRLSNVIELFTSRYGVKSQKVSAVAEGGVCAYLATLSDLVLDKQIIGRVCVVAGSIERNGRRYGQVSDRDREISDMIPGFDELPAHFERLQHIEHAVLTLKETVDSLMVEFELRPSLDKHRKTKPTRAIAPILFFGPAAFDHSAMEVLRRNINFCRHTLPAHENGRKSLEFLRRGSSTIALCRADSIARCALIYFGCHRSYGRCPVYVFDGEETCVECCLDHLAEHEISTEILVIME